MSPSPLHEHIHARFRAAFGEPRHTLGTDEHWALRPRQGMAAIDVLLDGDLERPALWVFDPHDPEDSVMKSAITRDDQVDEMISQIQRRLGRAASKPSQPGG